MKCFKFCFVFSQRLGHDIKYKWSRWSQFHPASVEVVLLLIFFIFLGGDLFSLSIRLLVKLFTIFDIVIPVNMMCFSTNCFSRVIILTDLVSTPLPTVSSSLWFHCKDLMSFTFQAPRGCKLLQGTKTCTVSKEFQQCSLGAMAAKK